MAPTSDRQLPKQHNPLLDPGHMPSHEILVERRRLGQTDLKKNGIATRHNDGTSVFDYAHLRVPLPKDLSGSGIFVLNNSNVYPDSYFLMRRSSDGFISATGMFKAAFPWSSLNEEIAERQHHKSLPSAGPEEVAGNVWISPSEALKLAVEYKMQPWIAALLDPEQITSGKERGRTEIHPPPTYESPDATPSLPPPSNSTRKRELRSASPTKQAARKIATPRKPRRAKQASVDPEGTSAQSAPSASQPTENGAVNEAVENLEVQPAEETEAPASTEDKVIVTVDETVDKEADVETVHTTVKVEVPANHPNLPLPDNAEDMVRVAKEMVAKATEADGGLVSQSRKRKADDLEEEETQDLAEVEEIAAGNGPLAKRQKILLVETLKKERVRSRTAIGLVATLAIGAALSTFL